MANDCIVEVVAKLVAEIPEGGVLLLDNVMFYEEEEKNDPEFAKKIASLDDFYVNDAFGTAHSAHASTEGVTKYLKPFVAGFPMQKELGYLVGAVANPKKPFAAIVGGSKVLSKIGIIESLLEKVDILSLGGGMIFTFYKAQGKAVGSSLVEEDKLDLATSLMEKGVSLLLPSDVDIADKCFPDANSKVGSSQHFYEHDPSINAMPARKEHVVYSIASGEMLASDLNRATEAYARSTVDNLASLQMISSTSKKRKGPSSRKDSLGHQHDDFLVISLMIAGKQISGILVDTGSATDVMFKNTFDELEIKEPRWIDETLPRLRGFTGESVLPLGKVEIPITFDTGLNLPTMTIIFTVVDTPSIYPVILGKPFLIATMAEVALYRNEMKIHLGGKAKTIQGDQKFTQRDYASLVTENFQFRELDPRITNSDKSSPVVIADKFSPDANSKEPDYLVGAVANPKKPFAAIPDGCMGLDIGPDAIKTFDEALDTTKTVFWNGPIVFEFDEFAAGTEPIAKKLAELSGKGVTTIIGGGDSVAAVEKAGLADKMSHISTRGGASLELLEGKPLPGVLALDDA